MNATEKPELNPTECQLLAAPFFQCCCNCQLRLTDYKHCSIDGQKGEKCVCSEVKGYVCVAFASDGVAHSGWPEHSCGCEMYYPRMDHAAAVGEAEYRSWGAT